MKVYISVDMEGLAGISGFSQETNDRERFRQVMNENVQWVIEGIQQSQRNQAITEITISDSHSVGRHLDYNLTELDDRVSLISGAPRPGYMMAGLDETYDVVFYIGYHSGFGTYKGQMEHAYGGRSFHNIWMNGQYMNESTINSAYAASLGVPTGLIIGDSSLKAQLAQAEMMPWVEFVETKEALAFSAARYYPKSVVRDEIRAKTAKVLNQDLSALPLYELKAPYTLRVEYNFGSGADYACLIPGVKLVEPRTVELTLSDFREMLDAIVALSYVSANAFPFENR